MSTIINPLLAQAHKRHTRGFLKSKEIAAFASTLNITMALRRARRQAFMIMVANRGDDGFVYGTHKGTGQQVRKSPSQFMYDYLADELQACERAKATATSDNLAAFDRTIREIKRDIADIAAKYDPQTL